MEPNLDVARVQAAQLLAPVSDPSDVAPAQAAPLDESAAAATAAPEEPKVEVATLVDRESLDNALFLLVTLGAEFAARRFGEKWAVTEQRAWRITRPLTKVVLKYCPALESNGPELELGIALGDYVLAGLSDEIVDAGREHIATATVKKVDESESSSATDAQRETET